MDLRKQNIIKISDELLTALLKFREENPEFTFSLRSRNSVQSQESRLELGQWFQGSHYIYLPLFKKGDSARKVKTIGFQIRFNKDGSIKDNYIEISFKRGIYDKNDISFHEELAAKLGIELNEHHHGIKLYRDNNYLSNLNDYIIRVRSIAIDGLKKYGLENEYMVSKDEFEKKLNNTLQIKRKLNN
jgi:hypothetical protein